MSKWAWKKPVPAIVVIENHESDDVHQIELGKQSLEVTIVNSDEDVLDTFEFADNTEEG